MLIRKYKRNTETRMFMPYYQTYRPTQNIRISSKFFGNTTNLKYLKMTKINQSYAINYEFYENKKCIQST